MKAPRLPTIGLRSGGTLTEAQPSMNVSATLLAAQDPHLAPPAP